MNVGLCLTCQHARRTVSDRGSVFYRCELARTNPDFRKYPALPILSCSGWKVIESGVVISKERPAPQERAFLPSD
jgi:hypothetical protein